ncbi:RT_RNaseH_2 domain-containing protein [Trichonephila inaurata madagascariensis]|uniref:RT_RNaseH_2 domain-containing protein n=1 Tax=Trichonephila inaurata madagascariensis TaxID=2747483 RepID=A0A8X6X7E2_9ARAC|nr:RT_RNaseH_2 domain-containing protein [Trichonephila inaurata madagascariensis]
MTSHYNLRSREKRFSVGDEVLILMPSSTHKLLNTWIGPAKLVKLTRPHSCLVQMEDDKETQPNTGIELNQMPDVLNSQQKHQLRKFLEHYEYIFRNRPGKANVKGHSVKVTADSLPKRLKSSYCSTKRS